MAQPGRAGNTRVAFSLIADVPDARPAEAMTLVAFLFQTAFDMSQQARRRFAKSLSTGLGGPMGLTRREAMIGFGGGLALLAGPLIGLDFLRWTNLGLSEHLGYCVA